MGPSLADIVTSAPRPLPISPQRANRFAAHPTAPQTLLSRKQFITSIVQMKHATGPFDPDIDTDADTDIDADGYGHPRRGRENFDLGPLKTEVQRGVPCRRASRFTSDVAAA
jgi:hypothetical protein